MGTTTMARTCCGPVSTVVPTVGLDVERASRRDDSIITGNANPDLFPLFPFLFLRYFPETAAT